MLNYVSWAELACGQILWACLLHASCQMPPQPVAWLFDDETGDQWDRDRGPAQDKEGLRV